MSHPSLWSLLQTLKETGHISIIINDELHVLSHDPDGHILEKDNGYLCKRQS